MRTDIISTTERNGDRNHDAHHVYVEGVYHGVFRYKPEAQAYISGYEHGAKRGGAVKVKARSRPRFAVEVYCESERIAVFGRREQAAAFAKGFYEGGQDVRGGADAGTVVRRG